MKVVFPGSFDPITNGHIDIVNRAVRTFGSVEILILNNINKKHFFDISERKYMLKEIFDKNPNVVVNTYDGLLSEYIIKNDINLIIRGIRNIIDFENEKTLARVNFDLTNGIETIYFSSNDEYISSSMVKELYSFNGNYEKYVDKVVVDMFKRKNQEEL